jgi:hypothetical protein
MAEHKMCWDANLQQLSSSISRTRSVALGFCESALLEKA